MSYEAKPNTGTLFKNDKQNDKQPDYRGNFRDVNGKDWAVAAWVKEGKKGKFLSFVVSEPRAKSEVKEVKEEGNELPF